MLSGRFPRGAGVAESAHLVSLCTPMKRPERQSVKVVRRDGTSIRPRGSTDCTGSRCHAHPLPPKGGFMNIRVACGLTAVALASLLGTQADADDNVNAEEAPISLVGCIQRETDYRRQNNSGKGGFLGFGGGLGDEYVLVNASRGADGAFGDCATATGGEAYELTGSGEGDLEPFVGQRVALTGTRKEAEIDSTTGQPTGGRQAGDDLRLFEVEVASFRALATPVQTD